MYSVIDHGRHGTQVAAKHVHVGLWRALRCVLWLVRRLVSPSERAPFANICFLILGSGPSSVVNLDIVLSRISRN